MDPKVLEIASGVLTKREVKTPMAFYTRVIWVILALMCLATGFGPSVAINFGPPFGVIR